ncbi:MAG: hypothetical protein KIT84_02895 [Labilithrix sp.]|nr:hypothetical protein [Labilithrix sp.]MCW5809929.1 hypothetical protein [Labilithrix sp.]
MKLAFAVLALAACAGSSAPSSSTPRSVLVVDRTFDRARQPPSPSTDLPAASYQVVAPAERWTIAIDGDHVVLTPIGEGEARTRIEGRESGSGSGSSSSGERRFELTEGVFAGGRFVLRGDEAELTIFGSGVPIVSSERGKIVAR